MALAGTSLTLLDQAKRTDPNGSTPTLVELLNQTNAFADDAVWIEGNGPTHHRTTIRSGLPAAAWRKLNYGVGKSSSTSVQVDDGYGMLEIYSEVDKSLVDLAADPGAFRLSEDYPFIESMTQTMVTTAFDGDTTVNPERFLGLTQRFPAVTGYPNSSQVVAGTSVSGSVGTSVWFLTWGENSLFMTFPKGGKGGLQASDKGQVTLTDSAGTGQYEGYRTHYKWDMGIVVRDWRHVARVQFDQTAFTAISATVADTVANALIDGYMALENPDMGRTAIYAHRSVYAYLTKLAGIRSNVNLTVESWAGKPVLTFYGLPIRRTDQLSITEASV